MRACLKTLGVDLDPRGNVRGQHRGLPDLAPNVFSAGDMRRGQSLVVWAIREGRLCARADRPVPDGDDESAEVGRHPPRCSFEPGKRAIQYSGSLMRLSGRGFACPVHACFEKRACPQSASDHLLILQPHPEHHHGRPRARARLVGVEDVAAQRALDPEVAGHLVDQVALDRVGLVVAAVALVVVACRR